MARSLYKIILPALIISHLSLVILSGCGDIEQEVASISVSPASATIGINQAQILDLSATDTLGLPIDSPTVTWSVSNDLGSVSSNGVFTAGSATGECVVTAISGTISDSTTISITDTGWLTGTVRDQNSNRVGLIRVFLVGAPSYYSISADTGTNVGAYEISGIPAGTYEVTTLLRDSYDAATAESVSIISGETKVQDIRINNTNQLVDLTPPSLP